MRKILIFFIFVLNIFFIFGCDYDNEVDYYLKNECDTSNMSFSTDVLQIIQTKCINCHNVNSFNGTVLSDYNSISSNINPLIESIVRDVDYMPKEGNRLPDCDINKIKAWKNQGVKNN